MQNSVFVNSGAIQGKILGSFYLKSTLLYDREVSYSWDKKNNELRYCLDVCVCVCLYSYTTKVLFFCKISEAYLRGTNQRCYVLSAITGASA